MEIDAGTVSPWARIAEVFRDLPPHIAGVLDRLPADHSREDFDRAFSEMALGVIRGKAAKATTVRRRFYKFLSAQMPALAESSPALHDEIILEFIGRLDELS